VELLQDELEFYVILKFPSPILPMIRTPYRSQFVQNMHVSEERETLGSHNILTRPGVAPPEL